MQHIVKQRTRLRGFNFFFMHNSDEHEISNAHKYKISRNSASTRLDKPRMLFNIDIYDQEKNHAHLS